MEGGCGLRDGWQTGGREVDGWCWVVEEEMK